jgi:hypothetical protein
MQPLRRRNPEWAGSRLGKDIFGLERVRSSEGFRWVPSSIELPFSATVRGAVRIWNYSLCAQRSDVVRSRGLGVPGGSGRPDGPVGRDTECGRLVAGGGGACCEAKEGVEPMTLDQRYWTHFLNGLFKGMEPDEDER